ncbi:uncharacterized protein LOC120413656 [Culex pipiens pallens]|uniref:uncharacterized protein LOC120413656 n=1 Tax=Culex pipiens pallens TaxID=42434 RepID=UPI001953DA83|nr:uncharacterized protein LOC120413656 [Culex pipiens pallens]
MNFPLWLLLMSVQVAFAKLSYRNHTCSPSSYAGICILGHLHYDPADEQVVHSFPRNRSHIRIVSDSRRVGRSTKVLNVDGKFYALLGRPACLEVLEHAVQRMELPRALRHGSFPDSYMRELSVEDGLGDPAVVYLELTGNMLEDVGSVGGLVNLEVLLLGDNMIKSIDTATFANLSRLRYLCLSYNYLSRISLSIFPKSLTHLDLFGCEITSLNYGELYYPNVEMLNIEGNLLTSIDGSALLLAMPKLKMVRIGRNFWDEDDDELEQTIQLFRRHNISLRIEADDDACENVGIEGVCFVEPSPPRTELPDILMSLVVILVAIALAGMLRWVFLAMNRK